MALLAISLNQQLTWPLFSLSCSSCRGLSSCSTSSRRFWWPSSGRRLPEGLLLGNGSHFQRVLRCCWWWSPRPECRWRQQCPGWTTLPTWTWSASRALSSSPGSSWIPGRSGRRDHRGRQGLCCGSENAIGIWRRWSEGRSPGKRVCQSRGCWKWKCGNVFFVKSRESMEQVYPDGTFHTFRASKSLNPRTLCCSEMSVLRLEDCEVFGRDRTLSFCAIQKKNLPAIAKHVDHLTLLNSLTRIIKLEVERGSKYSAHKLQLLNLGSVLFC